MHSRDDRSACIGVECISMGTRCGLRCSVIYQVVEVLRFVLIRALLHQPVCVGFLTWCRHNGQSQVLNSRGDPD